MQNKDFQPGGIPIDVAVFNQLVVDNQRLKLRVDALEKLFQDAQKEILTLQECMSTLISTELRTNDTELKNERCRTETIAHSGYVNDSNRLRNEISQFLGHAKCRDATKNGDRNHREVGGYNLERRISPNEHRSTQEKRLNLHRKVDDKYTTREYVEHSYKSREYLSTRSHKTTDRGSENLSRRNDNTDRSPYRRRADESRSSSILGRSQQLDSKYSKKRQIPEISTSKHYEKLDGDERSDNAIRSRDRVGNFSHEQRKSPNRHELCNSDKSNNEYAGSKYAGHSHRSSERPSRQRYENRSVDRNQRSSVVKQGQQQNLKHSEERYRIIERPTFDERDRKDDNFERGYHSDRCSNKQLRDRSEYVTGSSNMLDSKKPTESSLSRERNSVMTESPRNQRIVKRPQPINDDFAKNVNNSERSGQIIRHSETKEKYQYYLDRISSLTQKKIVSGTMESFALTQKRERSPSERNKTVKHDDLSSSKITLWSDAGKVESTIGSEYLSKIIYCTPMKFMNDLKNHKIMSPLHNTPTQPIYDSKERRSIEIRPVPLLLDVTTQNVRNESSRDTTVKPALLEEVESTVCESEDRTRISSGDSIEIQTVIETDDAEHGVFKRRRRKF